MSIKLPGIHLPLRAPETVPAPPMRLLQAAHCPAGQLELKRRRIWELANTFHCSVIGTCLTTAELRQILLKAKLPGVDKETDHELHARAVLLAGKKDVPSKLLQKALDRRHHSTVAQFGRARVESELRALWSVAVENAEVPGAYWAVLTHAQTSEELARQAFGEVHMLSHLVGAANRADIRRLRDLETENAALQEKMARQQRQLRDAVVSRDATIASLNDMLGRAITAAQQAPGPEPERFHPTAQLIADLRRKLTSANARCERLQSRVGTLRMESEHERKLRGRAELGEQELRAELEAAERTLGVYFPRAARSRRTFRTWPDRPCSTSEGARTRSRSSAGWRSGRAHTLRITTAAWTIAAGCSRPRSCAQTQCSSQSIASATMRSPSSNGCRGSLQSPTLP